MEPGCVAENRGPVDHSRLQGVEGRVGTVVDHVRRAHRSGFFHIVKPQPLSAAQDAVRGNAVAAQVVDTGVGHPVVRQAGDEFAVEAEVGQRYGDIGLASAVAGAEEVGLVETQEVGRREPHHDFPESNDLLFVHNFLVVGLTKVRKKPGRWTGLFRRNRVVLQSLRGFSSRFPVFPAATAAKGGGCESPKEP